jgi:hypothetical protein
MKRTAATSSRIREQDAVGVSLFPFLAVLICTMGALILLLVVVARQARLQAAQDTAKKNAQVHEDLQAAREWAGLEIRGYREAREKTEAQLAEARLALGHVEDHARRLRDQLARLEAAWNELDALPSSGSRRSQELQEELARLKSRIAQTERELAEARRQAAGQRASYAVVPYEGRHATHRRPIYIECRPDAVVLQPEGIVLDEDDFTGPLGPGNPLDAALRAVRERWLRDRGFDPAESGEPYPVLLVRPGGIEAYYAARAAMKSWASDFGYELIGEDWRLAFPPPDARLADEVRQAVATARARQQRLIAAAPRRYGRQPQRGYVAAPYRGGLVPDRRPGSSVGSGDGQSQSFGRAGGRFTPGPGGQEEDALPPGRAGAERPPGDQGQTPYQGGAGQPPTQETPDHAASRPGNLAATGGAMPPESLAKTRGRNWGLPHAAEGSVAITSPIRVDCHPDKLVLVPERGLGTNKVVPLGPVTQDALDAFVAAIWQYIERWGSAGRGMYWRPVLNVHVAPNAEARYDELAILLEGSGLEVRRNED